LEEVPLEVCHFKAICGLQAICYVNSQALRQIPLSLISFCCFIKGL